MRIIDPEDIAPTINPASPEHVSGRQVHRRILSVVTGGPASIDIGYNTFKAGIEIAEPYAYSRDEFCYMAAGAMELSARGVTDIAAGGLFVWRPTQAPTEHVRVTQDAISICAFSPARVDAWSHRLSREDVGRWDGAEDERPTVKIRNPDDVSQADPPWCDVEGAVDYRVLAATAGFTLSSAALGAGTRFSRRSTGRDEVWFVAAGTLSITQAGARSTAMTGHFIIWSPDDVGEVQLTEPCTLAMFSARADVRP